MCTLHLQVWELRVHMQVLVLPGYVSRHALVGFKWTVTMTTPVSPFVLISLTIGGDRF